MRALITGGARGIGAATVRLFAASGYEVITNYRTSRAQAEALEAETGCVALEADLSREDGRRKLFEEVCARAGTPDVLVNNAGVSLFGPFDAIDAERAREMYETNLFGVTELCRPFVPGMIRRKSGCIINVSSVWGLSGASCEADYSASKAAVSALTAALAKELGPSGIRVNCVAPGVIDTDMNARLSYEEAMEITENIPLMRLGRAEEIASVIAFLASDAASYITGQTIAADGGFL